MALPNSNLHKTRNQDDYPLVASQKLRSSSTISIKASVGDRGLGRPPRRRTPPPARPKKGPTGEDNKPTNETSSNPTKSKQEEIISLFKRIQSSISKGESGGIKEEEEKKEDESSEDDEPMAETLLDVLHQSRKKIDDNRRKKGQKSNYSQPSVDFKLTRPRSNFTRRSPIPSASSARTKLLEQKSNEAAEESNGKKDTVVMENMKLAELREAAKARGIKGYSRLKKIELVELLRSS